MGKLLIISATKDNNLILAKHLQSFLKDEGQEANLICLEDYPLPLYTGGASMHDESIHGLVAALNEAHGFIFCSPEYNGGVPPILSNAISWATVKSKNWRDAFNDKFALICTHSRGSGHRFISALRSQLEYMGTNVLARSISVTNDNPLNEDSAKRILKRLINIIKRGTL